MSAPGFDEKVPDPSKKETCESQGPQESPHKRNQTEPVKDKCGKNAL